MPLARTAAWGRCRRPVEPRATALPRPGEQFDTASDVRNSTGAASGCDIALWRQFRTYRWQQTFSALSNETSYHDWFAQVWMCADSFACNEENSHLSRQYKRNTNARMLQVWPENCLRKFEISELYKMTRVRNHPLSTIDRSQTKNYWRVVAPPPAARADDENETENDRRNM